MKRKKQKVIVVIPAYNEAKMIHQVLVSVAKYVDKIIVVDDASTDDTYLQARYKKTIVLRHAVNLGQGAALQTGFEYAKLLAPDIVVTFDADGQFNSSEIPLLVSLLLRKRVDVVLGSRFLGKTINMPFTRRLTLKGGIIFTSIFSNIKLSDTHNGFRVINHNALKKLVITQNRMEHASEIIDQIARNNLKYIEAPVTVRYSTYSLNKGQKTLGGLKIILNLIFDKIK